MHCYTSWKKFLYDWTPSLLSFHIDTQYLINSLRPLIWSCGTRCHNLIITVLCFHIVNNCRFSQTIQPAPWPNTESNVSGLEPYIVEANLRWIKSLQLMAQVTKNTVMPIPKTNTYIFLKTIYKINKSKDYWLLTSKFESILFCWHKSIPNACLQ